MNTKKITGFRFAAKSSPLWLSLLLAVGFLASSAQNIQYDIPPSVQQATELHREAWEKVEKVSIFCVQLGSFSGENSGARAQNLVNELNKQLSQSNLPATAYVVFDAPNHKVRVGIFQTKQEAYPIFYYLQADYPGAFITRDKRKVKDIVAP